MTHSHDHHDSSDHAHEHHHHDGHNHSHTPDVSENNVTRVAFAAIMTGLFMIAELIGGLISGSLALIADAGHMLTDSAALFMAWGAFILAKRPANSRYTYGYDRMSVLVAFVNGLSLLLIAIWIAFEAYHRLSEPGAILAGPMLWVALAGLLVNIIVFIILQGADQHNLNIRGAMLHVIGDLLGSIAAIIAALVIMRTGWTAIDPILSVLVAVIILRSAYRLIKESAHILLQGSPALADTEKIEEALLTRTDIVEHISQIHLWSLNENRQVLTISATLKPDVDIAQSQKIIRHILEENFNFHHITIELSNS